MKTILFLFISLIFSISAFSQVEIEWQKCFGDTNTEWSNYVLQTADGGSVVLGTKLNDENNYNVIIVKFDSQGNVEWNKEFGGESLEFFHSFYGCDNLIQLSPDGGYLFGFFSGSTDGDMIGNHGIDGTFDVFLVKLDSLGNVVWQRCYGGTGVEMPIKILKANNGGYLIYSNTGSTDGDLSGINDDDESYWALKINENGNIDWQKCFSDTLSPIYSNIINTSNNGYLITFDNNSYSGTHKIIQLDSLGNILWENIYTSFIPVAMNIIQTNNGDFVLSNPREIAKLDSQGNLLWLVDLINNNYLYEFDSYESYFDKFNKVFIISQTLDDGYIIGFNATEWQEMDIVLIKLDFEGNIQWQKLIGGYENEYIVSLFQLSTGEFILAGSTESQEININGNHGNSDFWVVKLDSQGTIIHQKCYGGTNYDSASKLMQTIDGGYIVAGTTFSNNGDIIGNHGDADIWIIKLFEPKLSGIIFLDENQNGIKETNEALVGNQMVHIEPSSQYSYSNNEGYFYFKPNIIGNHTISYIPQTYWYATTPNLNFNIDSSSQIIDSISIGVFSLLNTHDVSVYITGSPTRPSFENQYWLTYKNWGTVNASGTVNFTYDPLLTYLSASETPISNTNNTLVFDYNNLGPGVQRNIRVDFLMPDFQSLGDTLHSYAMITPLSPDTFITNNYDTLHQVITGSYDPNDKTVSPAGYGPEGMVLHGERLTYTVRFQNTGTDTAFTVVIRDTLNSNLNIESFNVEASSHPYRIQLLNGNEFLFTFSNILLPDSNVNEPASHGFIRYSVSPKQSLAEGTAVTNTAYIFFDYNPAVVTNTTLNTYVSNIPFSSAIIESVKTNVFPNPSTEYIYINLPEFTRSIEVFNSAGQRVMQEHVQKSMATLKVTHLPKGTYFVKIFSGEKVYNTKFVKE